MIFGKLSTHKKLSDASNLLSEHLRIVDLCIQKFFERFLLIKSGQQRSGRSKFWLDFSIKTESGHDEFENENIFFKALVATYRNVDIFIIISVEFDHIVLRKTASI